MKFENKNAAHAVNGSTGGKREQVFTGHVSMPSIPEAERPVKSGPDSGGLEHDKARRLAGRLTPRQRRDIVRLALVIQSAEA
ncbi:MAG: hypothetical protein K2L38_04430 [Dysosmobacter sp.]|nr:hypothetical protein [Dysosmobacter sp.]